MKVVLKRTETSLILETLSNLKLLLIPDVSVDHVYDFVDAAPESAEKLLVFFSSLSNIPEDNFSALRDNMPKDLKEILTDQIATCLLFADRCIQNGWSVVYIPKNIHVFLSIAPKELLFSLNCERFEKGIFPDEEDFLDLRFDHLL